MITNNTTTLYIGDTSIRLMVTRGTRITKLADVPLDISLSEIDSPERETELVNKIKLLFQTNKIGSKKVILGISGLHCLTRPISLPELPRTMLDEAVKREAKRVLPVPVEQLYISWDVLERAEGKIRGFMVGIPRSIADTLIRLLVQAGYKPYLMDIKPLALARLARQSTAVLVDVQPSEFDIVIMVNGIPQPIRTVPFPQGGVSTLEERLAIVKDELARTIQFYNVNNPENTLQEGDTMLVSGELIEEPELYESLAGEFGFQAAPLTSPLKCMKHLDPTHHLVNVGLALKEVIKRAGPLLPNFNALPESYLPKPLSMGRIIAIPTAAVAIGSIILLGMTVQSSAANISSSQESLQLNNSRLERRIEQKQGLAESITAMEQKIESLQQERQKFVAALNWFNTTGNIINENLGAAVDNVPLDLLLGNINYAETRITISGQALSEEEIIRYARNLEDTGQFSEVTIASVVRQISETGGPDVFSYTLSIAMPEETG